MFCPQCGNETTEALKFCKRCGADLRRVVKAMSGKVDPADWGRAMLEEYQEERLRKKMKTAEEKRIEEIKAGVITSSVGVGVTIFLTIFFSALASTQAGNEAVILKAIPFAGLIPLFVGLGLIFNGMVVSKKLQAQNRPNEQMWAPPQSIVSPETSPIQQLTEGTPGLDFSVTDQTTTRLKEPIPVPTSRDTQ